VLLSKIKRENKKGGIVTGTVFGIGSLIIGTIVILVVVQTLNDASLLGTATAESNATDSMTANFTTGLGNVSSKLPTILTIVAVVFLLGALVLLVKQSRQMDLGGGGSL